MGSKTRARQNMEKAGVPFVPGLRRGLESAQAGDGMAEKIGYPVMLKAAAGGGGKGMRLVHAPLRSCSRRWRAAQSEAQRSFGDSEVYIEKSIVNPRHIEMQVLADEHGNTRLSRRARVLRSAAASEGAGGVAFADRRCLTCGGAWAKSRCASRRLPGTTNAGTIEFLVDQQKNFYFLEMNTRLQVEHPVTELVTGLDLVHLQIRIAAGEKLPFTQEDVKLRGHAIECRIYAEDPDNNSFPSPGKITLLLAPSGPGIRRTAACTKAGRCRLTTIRCSPS